MVASSIGDDAEASESLPMPLPPAPGLTGPGPFDCFKRPFDVVLKELRHHPTTRPYSSDSGFLTSVEGLAKMDDQAIAARCHADPRLMQAMAALQGWNLTVTEAEIKRAERVGDMPKRDVVQLSHYEHAHQFKTPLTAKEAGNRAFQAGEFQNALACWLMTLRLVSSALKQNLWDNFPPPEPSLASTIHANCAAALLKLERPMEALQSVEQAIKLAPEGFNLSKAHYRAAQAHESLAKKAVAAAAAAKEWAAALESTRMALAAAKGAEAADASLGAIAPGSVLHLQRELRRYKDADQRAKAALEAANAQAMREAEAEVRRASGVEQRPSDDSGSSCACSRGSLGAGAVVSRPTAGYVRDIDLSTFALSWLAERLAEMEHRWDGGSINVKGLNRQQSDVHASIKEKRGKRSLFYDLTLMISWHGKAQCGGDGYGEMDGVLRMYNIAQDTRFCLGGDKETSYMFELGYAPKYHDACEPWVEKIKDEAAELFEHVVKAPLPRHNL